MKDKIEKFLTKNFLFSYFQLKSLQTSPNLQETHQKSKKYFLLTLLTVVFMSLLRSIIFSIFNNPDNLKNSEDSLFLRTLAVFMILMLNFNYFFTCLITLEILKRFKILLNVLNAKIIKIKIILKAHLQLYEIVEVYNKIFGFSMLLFITQLIVGTTFELFDIFSLLTSHKTTSNQIGFSLINFLFWILVNIQIIFFITCCGLTLMEARKFRRILYKKLRVERNEKIIKKLQIFILQIKHGEVKFSCGIFEFNWTTIQMVSIKVTTRDGELNQVF